ncbi:ATP synthase F1 subcomplex gamma subunit [Desulfocicer vacuolatum DSM 3385]|uniref:ATP synthase gamma chain n=1 Tax=Desulfocicer vacuolatum DSM 3385 TaxID=1121400 RepID=A0A1W1YZN2_9BACT|nr:ATP synthase F1 subunit gamma [Desulfocicer vacuolatum]SMC41542.1 ATP synthase F1 subcomplex gamma subunit [Desulfocicer vacuolatum DSM 3385]
MATLKEVQTKIGSVKKTKQITSAMKMVATSRLRGAQESMEAFKPYASKFSEVLGSIAGKAGEDASPLLVPREEAKKVNIILCTSDRGLCGGFNGNLIEKADKFIKESLQDKEVSFTCFGKRGRDWARKSGMTIEDEYLDVVGGQFDFSVASTSGQKLINNFLEEAVDEVYLVCSEFKSLARQEPVVKQILPIPPIEVEETDGSAATDDGVYLAEHICEPSSDELLGEMLPKNIFIQIYDALLQTSTSEHASRMRAMENATKACEDMIDELQTIFNKTRQAGITADLMDIVGGAEALNG